MLQPGWETAGLEARGSAAEDKGQGVARSEAPLHGPEARSRAALERTGAEKEWGSPASLRCLSPLLSTRRVALRADLRVPGRLRCRQPRAALADTHFLSACLPVLSSILLWG